MGAEAVQSLLLITAESNQEAPRRLIEDIAVAQQLQLSVVDQSLPSERLQGDEPSLVVLAPGLAKPLVVARAVRKQWPQCELIFLCLPGGIDTLRQSFGVAPLIGAYWSIVETERDLLGREIARSLNAGRRRHKLRTTLDRANATIAAPRADFEGVSQRRLNADYYVHNIIDAARDAIVGLDASLEVLYWSAGAQELFRLPIREAVGRKADQLPFWSHVLETVVQQVVSGSATQSLECTCVIGDVELTLEVNASSVRDGNGQAVGASLTIRDISAQAAERSASAERGRQLTEERQHLHRLFEQAPGFIAITQGPQHIVEIANRSFHQLVGLRDVIGLPAAVVFPQIEGQDVAGLLQQVYSTRRPYVGRGTPVLVTRAGEERPHRRFVDFIFQPVLTEKDQLSGIFCQGHDVTQQVLAQQALQRSQEDLQALVNERTRELEQSRQALYQSQKLEAIGKLTGGVAHDFNNVLQVITGNLQLLRPLMTGNRLGTGRLDAATGAVDRGAKLAAELLAFARKQPLRPAPTHLGRLLRNMDALLRQALGEAIEIETVVAGGLWTTMVDPNQLENVVLNLAINARDAMQAGGKLTLELSNAMLDELYTQTQVDVEPGQYVLLAVSDTGSGMSAQTIEHAFEPFYTTKPEGEGTGLGLSMAYGFAKQSSGHIRIYSELGSGTTVKLYLPRTEQPEVIAVPSPVGPAEGGDETILVVEDDLAVQGTVVELLSGLGYQVLRANDAQSALSILQSGLRVDLLFTDVVMPGALSSTELARQAKLLLPDIAVLFTSGYTRNAIVHGGRLDAGVELLSKPYRQEDLARKIRQLLGQRERPMLPGAKPEGNGIPSQRSALVVEDQLQLLSLTCEMLEELGLVAVGFPSAEGAVGALAEKHFDYLLVDVNLPGMSGREFAALALQAQPRLRVVFVSGDGVIESELPARSLPKPFSFDQLAEILQP
jgi:signal transduction histidine kinase/DNA-binding response OmpR family regulator